MKFPLRAAAVVLIAAVGVVACADTAPTTARFSPHSADVSFAKIKATDSLMMVTDVSFSDTALVLTRVTPLATDLSASATIGSSGGSISVQGAKIDIPGGALTQPTLITMTAVAGPNVAYEFQPHGLTFAKPVKVQVTIKGTLAETNPALLKGMHGSYYGQTTLDSAFVDGTKTSVHVKEHELGYVEQSGSQLKFYVDHFSGYLVSCGFTNSH
jgi:hypothetical protein